MPPPKVPSYEQAIVFVWLLFFWLVVINTAIWSLFGLAVILNRIFS